MEKTEVNVFEADAISAIAPSISILFDLFIIGWFSFWENLSRFERVWLVKKYTISVAAKFWFIEPVAVKPLFRPTRSAL